MRPGSRAADGAGSDGSKKLLSAAQVPASGVLSELVGGLADRAANAADQMGDRGFESGLLQRRVHCKPDFLRSARLRLDETGFQRGEKLLGSPIGIDHCAEHPDHIENPVDAPLIERVNVQPAANEIRGDVGLEIGERQDKIGLQGENLINVGRREGAHARLLAASLWRAT